MSGPLTFIVARSQFATIVLGAATLRCSSDRKLIDRLKCVVDCCCWTELLCICKERFLSHLPKHYQVVCITTLLVGVLNSTIACNYININKSPNKSSYLARYSLVITKRTFIGKVVSPVHFQCDKAAFYPHYRPMHFSAKRGIAIACPLSVCPSVCLSVRL